jgi:integrase
VTKKRHARTKSPTVDRGGKDFLTQAEMKRFLDAARGSRHGTRDHAMMLMTYRHGLRVSELTDLRLKDIDLGTARLYVRRKKDSLSTHQPIEGDELRALRAWLREREQRGDARSGYLFLSERGPMTRQALHYLVAETGKRAGLPFHVIRTCSGIRPAIISPTATMTRGSFRTISATRTSPTPSDILAPPPSGLKGCGDNEVVSFI